MTNLTDFYQSVLDQDLAPIVLCDLNHRIVYMNPSAVRRYADYGGEQLLGKCLMACHDDESQHKIIEILSWFKQNANHNRIYTYNNLEENKDVYMIALRNEGGQLIGYYEKHEYRTKEAGALYDFR